MKAIILAAGYAVRMYPLTLDKPKTLLFIRDQPLLNHIIKKIEKIEDVDEIIIVTNNKFYSIFCEWLEFYHKDFNKKIRIINDRSSSNENKLGGIGDLAYCIQKCNIQDDLLVLNSDNLFDFYLKQAVDFFNEKKKIVNGVYLLNSLDNAKKHGVVQLAKDKIVSFEEKPENPKSLLISIGVYIFPKQYLLEIVEYLKNNGKKDAPGYLIKYFVENFEVYGFLFKGRLYDIGSIDSYNEIKDSWKE
jgi:glucose-1-phosphate thymidylyltransferase